jgi:hypothetical protein
MTNGKYGKWQMENGFSMSDVRITSRTRRGLLITFFDSEMDCTPDNLFQGYAGWLMFLRIDIDAWARATLKLFASFGGQDN